MEDIFEDTPHLSIKDISVLNLPLRLPYNMFSPVVKSLEIATGVCVMSSGESNATSECARGVRHGFQDSSIVKEDYSGQAVEPSSFGLSRDVEAWLSRFRTATFVVTDSHISKFHESICS